MIMFFTKENLKKNRQTKTLNIHRLTGVTIIRHQWKLYLERMRFLNEALVVRLLLFIVGVLQKGRQIGVTLVV